MKTVSVVIPTFNSAGSLKSCLESLSRQTYKDFEVIVVDNFSTDATAAIAEKFGVWLIQQFCNKPRARNIGILEGKGKYVLLLDADMCLSHLVIEESVAVFERTGCSAIFIDEHYSGDGFWTKCANLEKQIYRGNAGIESPRFYRKEVFGEVLFDELNEGPDEYDFYRCISKNMLSEQRIKSSIEIRDSPVKLGKKFNHGRFFNYYRGKHKGDKAPVNQISPLHRVRLLSAKVAGFSFFNYAGLYAMKALEYVAFTAGIMQSYMDRDMLRLNLSVKKEFDDQAPVYEKDMYFANQGARIVDVIERETVLSVVRGLPGKSILDVGVGNGRFSSEFMKLGYKTSAVELSPKMCSFVEERLKGLEVFCGSIEDVSIGKKYDLVFSFRAFKYINDRKRALHNMYLATRQGGHVIIEMPNISNPAYFVATALSPVLFVFYRKNPVRGLIMTRYVSENQFTSELLKAGFKVRRVNRLFFFPHAFFSIAGRGVLLKLMVKLDRALARAFPRSIIFVGEKIGQ